MKKIILILLAFNLSGAPYESAQRFSEGDTISAEVLNDILDRIELSLKPIEVSELPGTWEINQYWCGSSINDPSGDATNTDSLSKSCSSQINIDGGTNVDGLAVKRTDTVSITAVSGSETLVDIAFPKTSMFYPDGAGDTFASLNEPKTHRCSFVGDIALFGCAMDSSITDASGRRFAAYFNAQRLSPTRIKLFWGPWRGNGLYNVLILDKINLPPSAPRNLSIALNAGTASLSWTAGDSAQTGYTIKRKSSSSAEFSDLATSSSESYEDSSVEKNNSYWYRIFATNSNGSSIGSNVIQIDYINSPPLMDLSSSTSVNEGVTDVLSVNASDADGDTLSYTLASQDPGNDAGNFTLSSDGALTFNSAPDWEAPSDYDTDNVYKINISVSDGTDSVSQDISIVVLDVSD